MYTCLTYTAQWYCRKIIWQEKKIWKSTHTHILAACCRNVTPPIHNEICDNKNRMCDSSYWMKKENFSFLLMYDPAVRAHLSKTYHVQLITFHIISIIFPGESTFISLSGQIILLFITFCSNVVSVWYVQVYCA